MFNATINLISFKEEDLKEAYKLYKSELYDVINSAFGWDEVFQQERFETQYKLEWFQWIENEEKRVGYVCFFIREEEIHLSLLILNRDSQKKGYGRQTMAMVEEIARKKNLKITLSTFKKNVGALKFYHSLGYGIAHQDEHFFDLTYGKCSNGKFDSSSKILIVGTSGSGKSTLARAISLKLKSNDIELDNLFWEKNWTQSDPEKFRVKILKAQSISDGFVMHGNYNKVRDLTWGKADIVIWLDYSRTIVLLRVIKRSLLSIIRNEVLWAGNKESIKKTFFSKESIILWSWQTYDLRKKQYTELLNGSEYKHVKILRFTNPRECDEFFKKIEVVFRGDF